MKAVNGHPVQPAAAKGIGEHLAGTADDHLVGLRAYLSHEHRVTHGEPQALALAHGVVGDALVAAQDISVQVHKIPRRKLLIRIFINKFRVVIIRDKADLLAVRLGRHLQGNLLCQLTDLLLGVGAHRHQRAGKLLLRQIVERVGLILGLGRRFFQRIAAVWQALNLRVVAGGDVIRPDVHAAL